jgi:hypothetical protein
MKQQQRMTYAAAATRGKVRAWKTELADRHQRFDHAYRSTEARDIVHEFVRRSSAKGRHLAFDRLHRLFGPGVTLRWLALRLPPHCGAQY